MTIAQYLRLVRERWLTVVLLTLLGLVGAGTFTLLQAPRYRATAQLFVSTSRQNGSLGELTQGSTFTQARVKSYTVLLTSPLMLEPVIRQLSLTTTPADLATQVHATSPLNTVLIDLAVTDPSPDRAADIANSIARQFPSVVQSLETPARETASPVKVSLTRAAVAPLAPVSPRLTLDLALGLLAGLGLGVGGAVLRDSLDRTVSNRSQVSEIAGAPVLGAVSDDPDTASRPLIVSDTFSARAEAYRQLRTNIRFLSVDHRLTSLVVTGSLQAEGKTTTAANLAVALAQGGEQVVLIDADLRRPSVADIFGLPSGVGLTSVLLGDVPVEAALQRWREDLALDVLAAGPLPPNPSELIGSARMAELIRELTASGRTVIVDSPPLLPVTDAAVLARVTGGALLVARVASTRVEAFTTAVESLTAAGAPILGLVLNRVPRRGRSASVYGGADGTSCAYRPHPISATAGRQDRRSGSGKNQPCHAAPAIPDGADELLLPPSLAGNNLDLRCAASGHSAAPIGEPTASGYPARSE